MGRAKARKQTKGRPTKRGLPWFAWLLIALGIAGAVIFVRLYPMDQPLPNNGGGLKAVIVDQLYSMQENETFIADVTEELEDYGFEVDLYQGDEIDVDLMETDGSSILVSAVHFLRKMGPAVTLENVVIEVLDSKHFASSAKTSLDFIND